MIDNVNQSFHASTNVEHGKSRTAILDSVEDGHVLPKGSLLQLIAPNYDALTSLLGDNDISHEGI